MGGLTAELIAAWVEGEEYKAAQQFQRNGGSLCCDQFASFLRDPLLRHCVHRWAIGRSATREEYEKLWDHGWGGVCMAPQDCDVSTAWRYAERAMEKYYRVLILAPRKFN
jgi:hypothetical protein